MIVRTATALLTGSLVLALTGGCTSSSSGPSGPSTGSSSTSAPGGSSLTPQTLADSIDKGLSGTTSAALNADASDLGATVVGTLALSSGHTTASDLNFTQGSRKVEVITVGRRSYAHLPAGQDTSGKPWVKVSATSSNEFVRGLAGSLRLVSAVSSIDELAAVVRSATSVEDAGATAAGHSYKIVLDPTAVPGKFGSLLQLTAAKQVPVQLSLDESDRPVRADVQVTVAGAPVTIRISVSDYNKPVHIAAPPRSQIAGG